MGNRKNVDDLAKRYCNQSIALAVPKTKTLLERAICDFVTSSDNVVAQALNFLEIVQIKLNRIKSNVGFGERRKPENPV